MGVKHLWDVLGQSATVLQAGQLHSPAPGYAVPSPAWRSMCLQYILQAEMRRCVRPATAAQSRQVDRVPGQTGRSMLPLRLHRSPHGAELQHPVCESWDLIMQTHTH